VEDEKLAALYVAVGVRLRALGRACFIITTHISEQINK
jgi:hypothetical protein